MKRWLHMWWHILTCRKKNETWKCFHFADDPDPKYSGYWISYHSVCCRRCGFEFIANRAWVKDFSNHEYAAGRAKAMRCTHDT